MKPHNNWFAPDRPTTSTILLVVFLALAFAPKTSGQENAAPRIAAPPSITAGANLKHYDVISVVPVKEFNSTGYNYAPDGYWAKALPVSSTIEEAYDIFENYRIIGLPDWATSIPYNINAKVDGDNLTEYQNYTHDQRRVMIQQLLADRFKLKTHFETRQLPIYLLKVSKKGPKLSATTSASQIDADGVDCLAKGTSRVGYLPVENCRMSNLAGILTQIIGYQVADQTGLTGRYDFELTWSPDTGMNAVAGDQDKVAEGPSIFSAIQSELGLKLELSKGPVAILVVDHIEMPSPN
jgi:uncharacterized protein (TIGR03435 family)